MCIRQARKSVFVFFFAVFSLREVVLSTSDGILIDKRSIQGSNLNESELLAKPLVVSLLDGNIDVTSVSDEDALSRALFIAIESLVSR